MTTDNESVRLRPASDDDARAVAEIWYRGWVDGHSGHVPDALVAVRTRESFELRAPKRVADTIVATIDRAVVGFVMVADDEVEQVYVSASHRGSGVADTLLREAEQVVAANGHEQAWLAVVGGNARARRFYERNGWTDQGRVDYRAAAPNGTVLVASHRYVKRVTPPA